MPLDTETEAIARVLDPLDHAVRRRRVDHDRTGHRPDRLVMGAVYHERIGSDDLVKQRVRPDRDLVSRFVARVGLLVGERALDFVRDVLDQRAAQRYRQQLLAAANAQHRQVPGERALSHRHLEGGAPVLGGDARMFFGCPEKRRVDVEISARDHEPVEPVEVMVREVGFMRQQHRKATRAGDDAGIILAQRIPRKFRISPGGFGIHRHPDHGAARAGHCRS